jgi:RHS repeat-associated protein
MIADQTGSLANMKRHDYLPFGEEIGLIGGRTSQRGYVADGTRQKFTQKERDNETNLDYFLARYYSYTQGRFTSPDPLMASARVSQPQSWNRYSYVLNNPLRMVDSTGLIEKEVADDPVGKTDSCSDCEETAPSQQQPSRVVLIVGDPGLGSHNVGRNFDRAAETRRGELERAGSEVIVNRASTVQDFNAALNNNGTLNGVEYFGHAGPGVLYIGENPGANTNLNSGTVSELSGNNLAPDATVVITGCNTAVDVGGNDSIARQVANQLQRTTVGYSGNLEFSSNSRAPTGETRHPDRGPTYMVPSSRDVRPVGFTPYIPVRPPY